ncbi:MAG: amidohydrolase [Firmicutes bacterium]|nr:amidohydrolase [Bacillota bacterium]
MNIDEMKRKVAAAVDAVATEICAFGEEAMEMPEAGYKEYKSSAHMRQAVEKLGLSVEEYARTGLKAKVSCGKGDGPCVALIGELDAISCFGHPRGNSENGSAHACGHNAQQAAAYGALLALLRSGVLEELSGSVALVATPAEEFGDMEYRLQLKEEEQIQYLGGKQQMVLEGAFDDVDMAMMLHAHPNMPQAGLNLDGSSLGFVAKTIEFYGRASHGSLPFEGINALNAAMMGLMGIHANREIFRDEDQVRIHPIITNGGSIVNSVPDYVRIETYVRASNAKAIDAACEVVDRAMKGAAMTIGAEVKITTIPGYLPLQQNLAMGRLMEQNALALWGEDTAHRGVPTTGSTDIGDLSQLIPCIQPTCGGYDGALHSKEFHIVDPKLAYVDGAKLLALTVVDLLADGAVAGRKVLEEFEPVFTKETYLGFLNEKMG